MHFRNRAAQSGRMESGEAHLVGGMDRQHLARQISWDFGDGEPKCGELSFQLVAIGDRGCGEIDIDDAPIPPGNLHACIAELRKPFADVLKRIERRCVSKELGQKYGRPLDPGHGESSRGLSLLAPDVQAGFRVESVQPFLNK